jgi:Cu/Ag efflux protein CusF
MPRHYALAVLAAVAIGATACGRSSASQTKDAAVAALAQTLGIPGAANSTPVVAASGSWVVTVWTASEPAGTNVYAAVSDKAGDSFRPPVRVNDISGEAHVYGEDPPRVAIAPAAEAARPPEIVVTWPSDRAKHLGLRSSRSLDGGRTFLPSASVGDEHIAGERGFQSVTIGADHVVRAAWLDQRRDPGTPAHNNVEGDWDPMHLMFASTSSDGRWAPETRLATNVCGCCKTAVALGRDGAIFVAFRNIYPRSLRDISVIVSRDDGRTFSPPVRVSEDHWALDGCPDDGPAMAVDRDGVVHIVWPTLMPGSEPAIGLFHASTRDGVAFTARQRIAALGSRKPSHPQLTVNACGALTIVWDEVQASIRRAALRQLTPSAAGDVDVGDPLILSGADSAVYPVVAAAAGGLVTAWTEIPRNDTAHSRIAVRRVPLDDGCRVSRAALQTAAVSEVTHSQPAAQRYPLRGQVISIDRAGRTLTINHEAIPGFMGAMTMMYRVEGARELETDIQRGTHVTATVVRVGDDYWIEDVKSQTAR